MAPEPNEIEMTPNDLPIPDDWGRDGLSAFLQAAHENSVLMFQHHRRVFDLLTEIDGLFNAIQNVKFPSELLPSFTARAWYAWRAAVRLATSGQVVESYSVMRASLECALYGHFISAGDSCTEVWLKRGTSQDATLRAKKMFRARAVKDAVADRDPGLSAEVERLYTATIDYGGHPNVEGHIVAAEWNNTVVTTQDMNPGTDAWKVAIQFCRDIGICDLQIFELMLDERFRDAGLSGDLDALRGRIDRMRAGQE